MDFYHNLRTGVILYVFDTSSMDMCMLAILILWWVTWGDVLWSGLHSTISILMASLTCTNHPAPASTNPESLKDIKLCHTFDAIVELLSMSLTHRIVAPSEWKHTAGGFKPKPFVAITSNTNYKKLRFWISYGIFLGLVFISNLS